MNELPNDVHDIELRAELLALRKKLEYLEAKQAAATSGIHPTARRRFPRRLIVASLALAALLAAGGLLSGQGTAIQALFIEKDGTVRIAGDLKIAKDAFVNAFTAESANINKSLTVGTVNNPANATVTGSLTAGSATVSSLTVGAQPKPDGSIVAGSLTADSANLSSLTVKKLTAVGNTLTIDGNTLTTGTINGARQPAQFSISGNNSEMPLDITKYCEESKYGCEIRVMMFANNKDFRVLTAQIYYSGGDLYTVANQGWSGHWRLDRLGNRALNLDGWIEAKVSQNNKITFKNNGNISTTVIIIYDLQNPIAQ
jgi:hypothetical protein